MTANLSSFYERQPALDKHAWKNTSTGEIVYSEIGQYPLGIHYRLQPDGRLMPCTADGKRSVFDDRPELLRETLT